MTQKVSSTLRNFITSNNAFCDALKKDAIYIDNNVIIELIIYYLTINKSFVSILSEQDKKLINELVNKNTKFLGFN